MKRPVTGLLFIFIFLANLALNAQANSKAQDRKTDSLLQIAKSPRADTNSVNALLELFSIIYYTGDYSKASGYADKALIIAERLKYKKGLALVHGRIGIINYALGNYPKALESHLQAFKLEKEKGDKKGIAACLNNIALVYYAQGNYPKALEANLQTLKIREELGDKIKIAKSHANIANVYGVQNNHTKALEYYLSAYSVLKETGDKINIAYALYAIGHIYTAKKDYAKSLEYQFMALKMREEIGDKNGIATSLSDIGQAYYFLDKDEKAIEYETRAAKMQEETGDKFGMASSLRIIGDIYYDSKNYSKALVYYDKSLMTSREIGGKENIKYNYEGLSKAFEKLGNTPAALRYYKLFSQEKDSLLSEAGEKNMAKMNAIYETEKKDNTIKLLNKDKNLKEVEAKQKEAELQKQRVITYSFAAGGLLVLGLLFFAIRGYVQKRKDNKVITEQKKEVEKQKDYAEQQHKIAEEQKHLVEEHQKEIIDSINYAQRIQRSLLASSTLLNENLNDYFILFKPKDIVSGDFYWASKLINGQFALVTADSTGHGVPGAIMSMLNIASLNEAVTKGIMQPDEILFETRERIINHLKNDGSEQGGKDGMDCSLLCFDFFPSGGGKGEVKLTCSAANNPVWIIRENELIEIKPDKMPCGKHDKDKEPFTLHTVTLQKGDTLYALTDGFPDQFGGPKGKKFMSKNLKETLMANVGLPMAKQKQILENTFKNWVGELEQIDDVTVIGIRI